MEKNKIDIQGLEEYGLKLKDLSKFNDKKSKFHIYIHQRLNKTLIKLSPKERLEYIRKQKLRQKKLIDNNFHLPYEIIGSEKEFDGCRFKGTVRDIIKLSKLLNSKKINCLNTFWVDSISGIKKVRMPQKKQLFTIVARFAINIENQTSGMQSYEERHLMILARDEFHAEKLFYKKIKNYNEAYLNEFGEKVTWDFEEILEIYHVLSQIEDLEKEGIETYSILKNRRYKKRK